MNHGNVDVAERLCDLAMKIILFFFVLGSVAVMTYFFVWCELHDRSAQAKAVSAYVDAVFVTAFGTVVYHFFFRKVPPSAAP